MTDQDFDYLRKLLLDRSAIVLDSGKQYLIDTRLTPLLRKWNLNSISDLVTHLRTQPSNGLQTQIVEALVTTETSFFRDLHPFEAIKKAILPELFEKRQSTRRLNIWCAACSTGQEPYTLALILLEHFAPLLSGWKVSLLASDLSMENLNRSRDGKYNQIEVNRGLPAALLVKYFDQSGTSWQLKSEVRSMVEFQQINLAGPWPLLQRLDLVLIRNVMIYFDIPTKKTILNKISQALQPDGYLLLGGAETTFGLHDSFKRVEQLKTGFYQLSATK